MASFAFPVLARGEVVAVLEFWWEGMVRPEHGLVENCSQVATQLAHVVERQQTSEELRTARDAAMESSRLKSEFMATMSHEIRTPMNGVIGLTDLLLQSQLDDRQRQYAEGVHGAGQALLTIINDILDFSKFEAGKLEMEMVDLDIAQVVEEAVGLMAKQAQAKGLELMASGYLGLPRGLRGDPARLRQVLLNLLSNAVRFTDRGEVVLRTRLLKESNTGVSVRFEVADTGVGIASADLRLLFLPFSQVDASTTRRFGGTGLGLAISRQLVEAMGGDLRVSSRPGMGSTFSFTLPFTPADVRSSTPPTQHLLRGMRVLVVDDNKTNRLILSEQLRFWQMEAEVASEGCTALSLLRKAVDQKRPFDFALLDLCMANMNGLELAQHISTEPALSGIRLVLLTSSPTVNPLAGRGAGIHADLMKPVRPSQLYDCMLRLIVTPPDFAMSEPACAQPPSMLRGHVLVAEDNMTNQMVACGILNDLGYRVHVATNGLEALEALAGADYSAVLMDCQMPEMDGYTAASEIRRREGDAQHTPIIAMTAGAMKGDLERCLAAGMDDYIAKPVNREQLKATLTRWVPASRRSPDTALDRGLEAPGGEWFR